MAVESRKGTIRARPGWPSADENVGAWEQFFDPRLRNSRLRNSRLRPALERMRRRHLMRDGLYARLRRMIPVVSLVGVWVFASHTIRPGSDLKAFVDSSMILRHLLLIVGAVLLWSVASTRRHNRRNALRRDIEIEVMLLTRASLVCGLFIYLGTVRHLGDVFGLTLAVLSSLVLLTMSYGLLAGTLAASAMSLARRGKGSRALIVGSGPRAAELRDLAQNSHRHLEIVGCLDDEYVGSDREEDHYLGGLAELPHLLKTQPVEVVLIGLPVRTHYGAIQHVIDVCASIGVECQYKHDVFETSRVVRSPSRVPSELAALGGEPTDFRHRLKRGLDIAVSGTLLLLSAPALVAIALAIRLTSPGPVFFVQNRYGYHRRIFPMYKFRTMVVDAEKRQAALEHANEAGGPVFKLKNDPRVTRIGALLRRTSLDELPQLWNVLRGDMSLVGPRPLPVRDVSKFDEWWLLRRFSVPPGLTCLWQVGGRSNTKFDEWIRLDLQYIDEWSLALDLRILARTIPAVMRGSGAV